jgi:hypothetical protein
MRMGARPMQNKIHYYVDWETANCNNKHDHWFLDKFFVNYSCSRLVYEEGS